MTTQILNSLQIVGDLTVNDTVHAAVVQTIPDPGYGSPSSMIAGAFVLPYGGSVAWAGGSGNAQLYADGAGRLIYEGVDSLGFVDGGVGYSFDFNKAISSVAMTPNHDTEFAYKLWSNDQLVACYLNVISNALNDPPTPTYQLKVGNVIAHTAAMTAMSTIQHTFAGQSTFSGTALFSSAVGVNSAFTMNGTLLENSVITPTAISTSQNNYNPTGMTTCINARLSASSAGLSITGIGGTSSGRKITLWNIGSNSISLPHDSASSTASARFYCPANATFTLRANAAVDIWYDTLSSRWRVLAP